MAMAAVSVVATAAHDDVLLQLSAERIQPGGTVEVRGDLGVGESFDIVLISEADGSRRVIASISATEEGHFQSFVVVPADVSAGDYLVEVAVDLTTVRAPLTVAGSPIDAAGGDGPEQEEGLVQPLPSGFGGGRPASAAPVIDATEPGSTGVDRSSIDEAVVIGLGGLLAVTLLGGLRLHTRRRSGP
ncbi:MAG: hypothetical protein ABIZ72_03190 [Candidatus Limnocylindrales bacterium]